MPKKRTEEDEARGTQTVAEAGAKGGRRTAEKMEGTRFYEEIGRKGGQRVKRLIEAGKRVEEGNTDV